MATPTSLPATFVAGNVLTAAQMNGVRGAFRILQVVEAFKADAFSFSSATFVDVTGLSATITPQSSTSKILCMGQLNTGTANSEYVIAQLVRGSTVIGSGTSGTTYNGISFNPASDNSRIWTTPFEFIDSPATTSATTYKIQVRGLAAVTQYVNRRGLDTAFGGSSNIILMEISA